MRPVSLAPLARSAVEALSSAVEAGDVAFSHDIMARGSDALWRRGGRAVAVIEVGAPQRVLLRVGLPRGAVLRLDGVALLRAEVEQGLPDAAEVAVDLKAGAHLITVWLDKAAEGWEGRGFHLRLLTPEGKPAVGVRALVPRLDPLDALGAGAVTARLDLVWHQGQPAWRIDARFSPSLPEDLVGRRLTLSALGARGAALPSALTLSDADACVIAPAASCQRLLSWPTGWQKARGALGRAELRAALVGGDAKGRAVARWGGDEPLEKVTGADLILAREVRALLDASAQVGPGIDLVRYGLQQLDGVLAGEGLLAEESVPGLRRDLQRHLQALKAGRDPLEGVQGLHTRAYRSPLDGRYQPFALYIPPKIDPDRRHALVVALHGFRGTPTRICRTALAGARPDSFVVCPHGYGDTLYRHAGEDDLFRVMALVEGGFPIDPDRVHLTGVSNGGLAAYELAVHHPDRWASVSALCALGDIRDFTRIKASPHQPHEARWLDRVSAAEHLDNARGLDFMIVYGARDHLPHASVERLAADLRRAGARVQFTLHEDLGHNVWDRTYERGALFAWIARKRRARDPNHIHLLTRTPRYSSVDGALILAADWSSGALLDARWSDPDTLKIDTAHISELRLPARPAEAARSLRLTIDGEGHLVELRPGHHTLAAQRAPSGWRVWTEAAPTAIPSWPRPEGRFGPGEPFGGADQLQSGPQLYVYGAADPVDAALNRYLAALDQARWSRFTTLRSRVVADRDVTEAELAAHNVILFGTPEANPLIGRLIPEARALLRKHGAGLRDVGLRSIHANPRGGGLAVILSTGTTPRGAAFAVGLPEFAPDRAWADEGSVKPPFDILLRERRLIAAE